LSGEGTVPRRIIERRIHQHDIGTVGHQTRGGEGTRPGRHVQHHDIGGNRIGGGVAAREFREFRVDLDQHQPDFIDPSGEREAGGADAGAEFDDAVARTRQPSPPPAL